MFGVIAYVAIAFAIAAVISFLYIVTRPIHMRDEVKSWVVFGFVFAFALATPYVGFEVMTKQFGKEMKPAVQAALNDAGIEGDMKYFKVLLTDGKSATVMALAKESANWGGTDTPVVRIKLKKDEQKNKWKAESYVIVFSENRNKDGLVIPPYW